MSQTSVTGAGTAVGVGVGVRMGVRVGNVPPHSGNTAAKGVSQTSVTGAGTAVGAGVGEATVEASECQTGSGQTYPPCPSADFTTVNT